MRWQWHRTVECSGCEVQQSCPRWNTHKNRLLLIMCVAILWTVNMHQVVKIITLFISSSRTGLISDWCAQRIYRDAFFTEIFEVPNQPSLARQHPSQWTVNYFWKNSSLHLTISTLSKKCPQLGFQSCTPHLALGSNPLCKTEIR